MEAVAAAAEEVLVVEAVPPPAREEAPCCGGSSSSRAALRCADRRESSTSGDERTCVTKCSPRKCAPENQKHGECSRGASLPKQVAQTLLPLRRGRRKPVFR